MRDAANSPWKPQYESMPDGTLRLFCFPYAGGSGQIFRHWQQAFSTRCQIFAVQPPGRWERIKEPPFNRMRSLVSSLADSLRLYLRPPFAFFGHSFGAIVAFELARELRRRNFLLPDRLYVAGSHAPQNLARYLQRSPALEEMPLDRFIDEAASRDIHIPKEVRNDRELLEMALPALRADLAALTSYVYAPEPAFVFPITAFGGNEDSRHPRTSLEGWREQTSSTFDLQMFSGGHFFVQDPSTGFLNKFIDHLTRAPGPVTFS